MLLSQERHYKNMFFFEISDQGVVNIQNMVLIRKSDTRGG